jgi:hypothetical protein
MKEGRHRLQSSFDAREMERKLASTECVEEGAIAGFGICIENSVMESTLR